jgi:hypothetical protein
MGATASHASLVISQSSVRGLSEAIIWRAPPPPSVDLKDIIRYVGANASALSKLAAAMNVMGAPAICIFSLALYIIYIEVRSYLST